MDDEDSQEELINRRTAPGKKSVLALISDEEEEEESDETGSEDEESGEDGEDGEEEEEESEGEADDLVDGSDSSEDDEDDEVECDDEEEEALEIAVDGVDSRTARLATNGSCSSDEEGENCPICLNVFRDQVVGTPENCNHYFCLDCIVEWAKNANSCPVDRIAFSCICIRAHCGGGIIKKVPVENHAAKDAEEEEDDDDDTTNCEVCGRCDREDRLLLCDGCDAGFHMECLNPPLNAIPVDEWFCPECAVPNSTADEEEHISEAEVSSLTAEVQPVASRLRTSVRTRAIARTRQSERVRENVNRLRTRTARRNEHVPSYLTTSLLDETIETVVAGLNTAVYQRPLQPRATTTRRKKTGRRRKGTSRKKPRGKVTTGSWMTGKKTKKRRRRFKGRKGRKLKAKKEVKKVSTRSRIAKTLGLCKPVRGVSIPAVRGSLEPSLGLLRSDIGAASLSVFGDPFALDPYDSQEEQTTGPPSPVSTKRRVLSRSALRSHQPVARPISVGLSRRAGAAIIREHVEPAGATPAPVSDLLGSILSEQSRLMMSSSDIVINRDGSLLARKSANTSSQKSGSGESREGSTTGDNHQGSSSISGTSSQTSSTPNTETPPSSEQSPPIRPLSTSLFPISPSYSSSPRSLDWILNPISKKSGNAVRFNSSFMPRAVQVQNIATAGRLGSKPAEPPRFNGNNKRGAPSNSLPSSDVNSSQSSTSRGTASGHPPEPGAKRIELSDLPRIPKIKREVTTELQEHTFGKGGTVISDASASRLTGKGESRRPSRFSVVENSKHSSSKDSQESFKHVGSLSAPTTYSSSTVHTPGDKCSDSTALSAAGLKITINPGSGPCNRLFSPSMSSPFRPVENKSQNKPEPPPNCPISKKEKLVKNEIYDPFDPTGSNSSSACSSPEREEPSIPVSEHIKSSPDVSPNSPVTLNSPLVAQTSPCVTQASPDISSTSPDVAQTSDSAWMVPEVTRALPDAPRSAPDISRTVPEVIRTVPEVSMVFPEVTRLFTEVTRVVPEVNRTFTEVTRKFPEVTRNVPEVKMTFPKVTMKFPDATRKFSDVSRKFPEVTRKFPEINRTFPEVTRTFPEVSLKFPEVTRKLPEVSRTFPEVTGKLPDITRTFPGISRAVPEVTRTFPSDSTKPGAFRSFRLLTTSSKVGVSGLGSDFSDAPPTKTIHRDVVFEEPIKDDSTASEGEKDLKRKDIEPEKKGGKESYKNFHASVTVKVSPERTKSSEVSRIWHDKEERSLVSVKADTDVSPVKNKPQKIKRPYRDTKSRSRSRSNSSSHSRKKHKKEKKLLSRERKKKRSRSRSRSHSREQNSRSASWSTEEEHSKKSKHKNKGKRLSSDHSSSSSHERQKKKKIKEVKKSKKKDRRKTRSRSVSHGSTSSELYESKKKKKRKSRSRDRSRSSSIDREKRRKRKSEKNYERYDKEGTDLRFRERQSKEKKKARSISPQISKEGKRARSKEKWQAPKDRTVESKEMQLSPHRVVKLTGTYEENIPKLTVSCVDNIPRRTVHSLVVNPETKEQLNVQRYSDSSDTSLETDSDLETSDEEKLNDGLQQQILKEASSEAVSLSGENESTPSESPGHLYSSSKLNVTDSVGSGIVCMHSDNVEQEMATLEGETNVPASSVLKNSDMEAVSHSPSHRGAEEPVSNDIEQSVSIEKGEEDDVDKMLDDNLNLVQSSMVLSEVAQNKSDDDSENKLHDGTPEKSDNCELYPLGLSTADKLVEDSLAKFVENAPIKSSEVLHDKPAFCTLQVRDETPANDSVTASKLGDDADSDVDDELKKDQKQVVDRTVDQVENVEDNAPFEDVGVELLDTVSLQPVDSCTSEQVNRFSSNQEGYFSHDQPSNLPGQDFECSTDHGLDGFTDKKDESSVHEEDFAVCRPDNFVGSGADEFVDRGMDHYSDHVVDGDVSPKVDRFADHQGDRLTDDHVDQFTGNQIMETDDHHEEKFEDHPLGDFGGRSMEEFASYLLEKFAGHGIGDFTCPKVTDDVGSQVTDVASNQVTIIPGIGMGDVTDYQEEDTGVCQDDDDDDDDDEYAGEQLEMDSSQSSALKAKQQVKRVTWNLQEEDSDTSPSEKTQKVPFYKLLRSKEGPWKPFDALSQTSNPVHSPDVPLTPPLPSSLPSFTPVSEPSAHYIMQERLPLLGCVAGSTVTSELGNLATASEPGTQSASTCDAEEKTMFQKPSLDRITQEYLKKLHIQERAVEEVKLAIKPFYQTREITKDEYKDILRKAVSKICHSKSGEINPVKVANLIKAYVERYKHLRRHKREIEYHDLGPESP